MPENPTPTIDIQPLMSHVVTANDLSDLRHELEAIETGLFQAKDALVARTLHEETRATVATALSKIWQQQAATTLEARHAVVENIISMLKAVPTIHLTLAYEPTLQHLQGWQTWFGTELKTWVILEIELDPAILGGAVIIWQGQYRDFSLRKKLSEMMPAWKEKYQLSVAPSITAISAKW